MKQDKVSAGKRAAAAGFANEQRLLAALLARGFNASRVDLPHSTYDLVVELAPDNIVRVQVKTIGKGKSSISFTGGARGGVDRAFKSRVKNYTQSTETSDIVVGVESHRSNGGEKVDFYFIPTIAVERLGRGSISKNKVPQALNNWDMLRECKDKQRVSKVFADLLLPSLVE